MPFNRNNNISLASSLYILFFFLATKSTSAFISNSQSYGRRTTCRTLTYTKYSYPSSSSSSSSSFSSTPEYEEGPSDYDPSSLQTTTTSSLFDNENDILLREELKRELLLISSITNRGQYLSPSDEEYNILSDIITQLEALNPTPEPANIQYCLGDWDLCLSSTNQVFRSSLLFQSVRALFGSDNDRNNYNNDDASSSYSNNISTSSTTTTSNNNIIMDNLFNLYDKTTSPFQKFKRIRQSIQSNGVLTNEIDIELSTLLPFPTTITGTLVTDASYESTGPELWNVKIGNTFMKNLNSPFPLFWNNNDSSGSRSSTSSSTGSGSSNGIELNVPVDTIYRTIRGSVPIAKMKTYYIDEAMKIVRDQDDNFYVFIRV